MPAQIENRPSAPTDSSGPWRAGPPLSADVVRDLEEHERMQRLLCRRRNRRPAPEIDEVTGRRLRALLGG